MKRILKRYSAIALSFLLVACTSTDLPNLIGNQSTPDVKVNVVEETDETANLPEFTKVEDEFDVNVGDSLEDILSKIEAVDKDGNVLTPTVEGDIDFTKPGVYTVVVKITDGENEVTKEIKVTVKEETASTNDAT